MRVADADPSLARRAAAGDSEAIAEVLTRVAERLRKVAWHLCHDDHESEDLCQQALMKLADPAVLGAYRGDGSLDGYLIRCGTRAMVSYQRTHAYRDRAYVGREELRDDDAEATASGSSAPMAVELREAMAELPERARLIVLLLAVGDLTYHETAETVGVPVGTVRSTYARARDRLQQELERREYAS